MTFFELYNLMVACFLSENMEKRSKEYFMFSRKLSEIVVYQDESLYEAYWRYCKYHIPFLVMDREDKFLGIAAEKEFQQAIRSGSRDIKQVGEIMNTNCTVLSEQDTYKEARNIYAEKEIEYLPVVDQDRNIIDLFSRRRAFYREYFFQNKLNRMHYASLVWIAAKEAKALGYKRISVAEFGVAGGDGLLALKFHAREIGRLFHIEIQVYGFDTGQGMPENQNDYRNLLYMFGKPGIYKMDYARLEEKLEDATLILGDIAETSKAFFETYQPAPLGAVMVDVDFYTSTEPILEMLNASQEHILPRIYMYFDDIINGFENLGENLAVRDFNERHKGRIQIAPDGGNAKMNYTPTGVFSYLAPTSKVCHHFGHELYNKYIWFLEEQLPIKTIDF